MKILESPKWVILCYLSCLGIALIKLNDYFCFVTNSLGKTLGSLLHEIFEAGLETFALVDLVSDFYIFYKLTSSEHVN